MIPQLMRFFSTRGDSLSWPSHPQHFLYWGDTKHFRWRHLHKRNQLTLTERPTFAQLCSWITFYINTDKYLREMRGRLGLPLSQFFFTFSQKYIDNRRYTTYVLSAPLGAKGTPINTENQFLIVCKSINYSPFDHVEILLIYHHKIECKNITNKYFRILGNRFSTKMK